MRVFLGEMWYDGSNERLLYQCLGGLFGNRINPLWAFPFGLRFDCPCGYLGVLEGRLVRSLMSCFIDCFSKSPTFSFPFITPAFLSSC